MFLFRKLMSSTTMEKGKEENLPSNKNEMDIAAVEKILRYSFRNPKLLVDALTHPSYAADSSYKRLRFMGNSALKFALTRHIIFSYPRLRYSNIALLQELNFAVQNLGRVAVVSGLFSYFRYNKVKDPPLHDEVIEFSMLIWSEYNGIWYNVPKVLPDIVKSIAGAVYVDLEFDVMKFWTERNGINNDSKMIVISETATRVTVATGIARIAALAQKMSFGSSLLD